MKTALLNLVFISASLCEQSEKVDVGTYVVSKKVPNVLVYFYYQCAVSVVVKKSNCIPPCDGA